MSLDFEPVYQKVLLALGAVNKKSRVYLVYSTKHSFGQFVAIRADNYRAAEIDEDDDYYLIGTYNRKPLPKLARITGDVYAFIKEQAEKEDVDPDLFGLIQSASGDLDKTGSSGTVDRHA